MEKLLPTPDLSPRSGLPRRQGMWQQGARSMDADWVREIRDRCVDSETPFFFKQWGGVFKKRSGRTLDHRTWDQMPERV